MNQFSSLHYTNDNGTEGYCQPINKLYVQKTACVFTTADMIY